MGPQIKCRRLIDNTVVGKNQGIMTIQEGMHALFQVIDSDQGFGPSAFLNTGQYHLKKMSTVLAVA